MGKREERMLERGQRSFGCQTEFTAIGVGDSANYIWDNRRRYYLFLTCFQPAKLISHSEIDGDRSNLVFSFDEI